MGLCAGLFGREGFGSVRDGGQAGTYIAEEEI
jgi:hypothetical protein